MPGFCIAGVVLTVCAQYLFTKKEKGGEGGTGGDGGETDGHGSNSSEVPADPNDIDGWMALAHSERLKRECVLYKCISPSSKKTQQRSCLPLPFPSLPCGASPRAMFQPLTCFVLTNHVTWEHALVALLNHVHGTLNHGPLNIHTIHYANIHCIAF